MTYRPWFTAWTYGRSLAWRSVNQHRARWRPTSDLDSPMPVTDVTTPRKRFNLTFSLSFWPVTRLYVLSCKSCLTIRRTSYSQIGNSTYHNQNNMSSDKYQPKPIGIVGFQFSKGQPRPGADEGPRVLREAELVQKLESLGNTVRDYGNVPITEIPNDPPVANARNPKAVGTANKGLATYVTTALREMNSALVLGGDHSMGIGSIYGHAQVQPNLVVLWIDAHADINTPLTSTTGNMHGMPLAFVVKELQKLVPKLPEFDWLKPCISVKDIAYIGLRDVDGPERAILEEYGIASYSMQEVDQYGIAEVVDRALKQVDPSGNRPIHLSFDVDSMDPSVTPSTGTPVPGGLTLRDASYLGEIVAATNRLAVLDITEVNPKLGSADDSKLTVRSTIDVTTTFFGRKRQGNIPANYSIPQVPEQ